MGTASNLDELFMSSLQDLYDAEKQILEALPKMAKQASSRELRQALERHQRETEGQIERLEDIFEMMDQRAKGKSCEAIEGLIEEGEEMMEETDDPEVRDAGLIAAEQAVEHYEIAKYGTLRAWAEQLGMQQAAQLLQQTLDEEKRTDALLTEIAMQSVNARAV